MRQTIQMRHYSRDLWIPRSRKESGGNQARRTSSLVFIPDIIPIFMVYNPCTLITNVIREK